VNSPAYRVLLVALIGAATRAGAQNVVPEARVDVLVSRFTAAHAGAGITASAGTYLRTGVIGGVGLSRNGLSGRIDFVNRFHLDPFRQHRWAPYAGGGFTARFEEGERSRVFLLLIVGVDGPRVRGLATSVEAGLGAGGRIGVAVRRAKAERR
jgi:hypothetical protein